MDVARVGLAGVQLVAFEAVSVVALHADAREAARAVGLAGGVRPLQRTRWCFQLYRPASPLVRTSPRGLAAPSDVLSASDVVAYLGFRHRLLQPWLSRTWLLQSCIAPPCSCTLSNAIAIRPWAFAVLQGLTGKPPPCLRPFGVLGSAPLMGSRSLQRSSTQRIRSNPGIPTSPAVASSGFEPSRRLDPLRAFPVSLPGPLLGLLPSGLFSSRRSSSSFEDPYPPGIA